MMSDQDRPSPTVEDYLGVIYTLDRDEERVIAARLVESLDVSAPTVTATLRRMVRDGWIAIDQEKEIRLTDAGRLMAMSVIRRHMLTEWMLARVLKLPLSEIHHEAHQIEHTLSAEVEQRMQLEMEDPQCCPHGNPLPGYEDQVSYWMALPEVEPGTNVILKRIHENLEANYDQMAFLDSVGLMPGAVVCVVEVLQFNETIHVQVRGQDVTLGLHLAANLFVSPLSSNSH